MKAIAEFPFKIIMNNDVEVLRMGWEYTYPLAMRQTGFHHFCFRQLGMWGASNGNKEPNQKRPDERKKVNNREIATIHESPQGAILAYDQLAFNTVGYFDSNIFSGYGRSHHLWSFRVSVSGIQPEGIHDIAVSNDFFKVHDEDCTTPPKQRLEDYRRNTKIFDDEMEKLRNGERPVYVSY